MMVVLSVYTFLSEISVLDNTDSPSCGAREDLEHPVLLRLDHAASRGTLFAAFQKAGRLHLIVRESIFRRGGKRTRRS